MVEAGSIRWVWSSCIGSIRELSKLIRGGYADGAPIGRYSMNHDIFHMVSQPSTQHGNAVPYLFITTNHFNTTLTCHVGDVTERAQDRTDNLMCNLKRIQFLSIYRIAGYLIKPFRGNRQQGQWDPSIHRRFVPHGRCDIANADVYWCKWWPI